MKSIILSLVFLASNLIFATGAPVFIVPEGDKLPLCKDPSVILSIKKIPCRFDERLPENFDLPNFEINLEDLHKIFQGAESSGGRIVSPARTHNRETASHKIKCEAKLLTKAGKTINFYSSQSLEGSLPGPALKTLEDEWFHAIVADEDIGFTTMTPVPLGPSIRLGDYEITVELFTTKTNIKLCELIPVGIDMNKACQKLQIPAKKERFNIKLYTELELKEEDVLVEKHMTFACKLNSL